MERDKRKERTERTEGTVVEVAVGSSAAALGLTHPVLGAVAGGMSPAIAEGIKAVVRRLVGRQREKSEYVLAWVAHLAGIDPKELERRCQSNPALEQLLLRVVSASEQTALPEKLVAYALSLVAGASSSEKNNELRWETAFVLALQDLDPDDLELLRRIDQGWEVTRHPLLDPPGTFSEAQLRQLVGDSSMLPMEIAVLQRHGLIGRQTAGGGPGPLMIGAPGAADASKFLG
jgi:hypothetical protein